MRAMVGDPAAPLAEALDRFAAEDPGRSAVVVASGRIAGRASVREAVSRPAASLLKLPLVAAVLAGGIDLERRVPVAAVPASRYPSLLDVLEPTRSLTVRELCGLSLAASDNRAAEWLLAEVGPTAVNAQIADLGLQRTRLAAGFTDRELGAPGRANSTTAAEALTLLTALLEREPTLGEMLRPNLRANRIPLYLPEKAERRHKTGSLAGVVIDVGVIGGEQTDLAASFCCDAQADAGATSLAIGRCVRELRRAVGEPVRESAGS